MNFEFGYIIIASQGNSIINTIWPVKVFINKNKAKHFLNQLRKIASQHPDINTDGNIRTLCRNRYSIEECEEYMEKCKENCKLLEQLEGRTYEKHDKTHQYVYSHIKYHLAKCKINSNVFDESDDEIESDSDTCLYPEYQNFDTYTRENVPRYTT